MGWGQMVHLARGEVDSEDGEWRRRLETGGVWTWDLDRRNHKGREGESVSCGAAHTGPWEKSNGFCAGGGGDADGAASRNKVRAINCAATLPYLGLATCERGRIMT